LKTQLDGLRTQLEVAKNENQGLATEVKVLKCKLTKLEKRYSYSFMADFDSKIQELNTNSKALQ